MLPRCPWRRRPFVLPANPPCAAWIRTTPTYLRFAMATFETGTLPSSSSSSSAVREIQSLMDDWRNALVAKDLDRLIQHYDPAVRFFDAVPPYEHQGATAYRRTWENMM